MSSAALYPATPIVLVPTLLASVVLMAHAAWSRRGVERNDGRILWAACLIPLAFGVVTWVSFDTFDRRWPVWLGLVAGSLLGVLWEWALPTSDADDNVGAVGSGIACLTLLTFGLGSGVSFANASLGLIAGWSCVQLVALSSGRSSADGLGALAGTAAIAGTCSWAMRLTVHDGGTGGLGTLVLALSAIATVGLALAGRLPSKIGGYVLAPIWLVLAGGALIMGPYAQSVNLLWALIVGALLALVLAFVNRDTDQPHTWLLLVLTGGVLLVENRLQGVLAMGIGSISVLTGLRGESKTRNVVGLILTLFAVRVWLQMFLDRTNLTGYGIDLTHPYAFAGLLGGALALLGLARLFRLLAPRPGLSILFVIAAGLFSTWLGFLIHVEAVGSLLAGMVLSLLVLTSNEGDDLPQAASKLAPIVLANLSMAMLAAPWLVSQLNATRHDRVVWLVVSAIFVAVTQLYFLRVQRHEDLPSP